MIRADSQQIEPDACLAGLDLARAAVGGPVELARKLGGISSQAISQWRRVPAERVIDVERVTGVPRQQLRPDLYPERAS